MDSIKEKIRVEGQRVRREIREKVVGYILAAFGLVAALAWNEAIRTLIDLFFPVSKNTLLARFAYATALTAIVVVVSVYLTRLAARGDKP